MSYYGDMSQDIYMAHSGLAQLVDMAKVRKQYGIGYSYNKLRVTLQQFDSWQMGTLYDLHKMTMINTFNIMSATLIYISLF
eukprot:scaffold25497_cov68-Cyclotella_meneghiniana.AAC.3